MSDKPQAEVIRAPDGRTLLTRGTRPFKVRYRGLVETVQLPGYYPEGRGEGTHVGNDYGVVSDALERLKARHAVAGAGETTAEAVPTGVITGTAAKRGPAVVQETVVAKGTTRDPFLLNGNHPRRDKTG